MKILKGKQREILEMLQSLNILSDFYLAGGTAILLKYDHRPSEDFDFFLFPEREFMTYSYEKVILKTFKKNAKIIYEDEETLIFTLDDIKVSLFSYPYPILKEPELKNGILIASDEDIACMKAHAISSRGLKKDFFDLWFLIQIHKWNLKEIVDMLREKYKSYNLSIFIKSLTYFEDAEKNKDFSSVEEKWQEIKKFFINYVKAYINS